MKTIKQKTLSQILEHQEQNKDEKITRKMAVLFVLRSQGAVQDDKTQTAKQEAENWATFHENWRGYYSVGFQQWEEEGLITRTNGYRVTELGKAYIINPKIISELKQIRNKEESKRFELLTKYRDLQRRYHQLINNLDRLIINA